MSICHVCAGTGIEIFDDTDSRGYLCTSSRPCARCERHERRDNAISMIVAVGAFIGALALTLWGGLPR